MCDGGRDKAAPGHVQRRRRDLPCPLRLGQVPRVGVTAEPDVSGVRRDGLRGGEARGGPSTRSGRLWPGTKPAVLGDAARVWYAGAMATSTHIPTREEAWSLLTKYTEGESLRNHALAVEATMRRFAKNAGEDEEKWGAIGLVHDLDWEKYPDRHCEKTKEVLEEAGWPQEYIRAVLSHAWGFVTDVEPVHYMEKVLYTIDELTGLITATALVRPSRSVVDIKTKSVKKKWKDKSFSAGVDRGVIEKGAEMLEMPLDDVIAETIEAMRGVADDIGLGMTEGEDT